MPHISLLSPLSSLLYSLLSLLSPLSSLLYSLSLYQSVLQHLGIARADVLVIHRLEESRVEDDAASRAEHANLVFQSAEVDARLAAHRGVDHGQQCRRDVDVVHAPLEG